MDRNTPLPHALPAADTLPAPKTADCPVCGGDGMVASEGGTVITECPQCDGVGRVTQEVADEWRRRTVPA